MSDIFSDQIKEALENAQKLKIVGETELSKKISIKAAKKVSNYNNVDLIGLFYGEGAYERIQDASDAAKCIFISKCVKNVYDVIAPRKAANSSSSAWAIADTTNSNKQLRDFFAWLQKRGREVKAEDCTYFKMLLNVMSGCDKPYFKMSDRVRKFTLIEIIRKLVSGEISITDNGELR